MTTGTDDRAGDLLETVDLFLNGDGSGIGGRDLIRKLADALDAALSPPQPSERDAGLEEAISALIGAIDEWRATGRIRDLDALSVTCSNARSLLRRSGEK